MRYVMLLRAVNVGKRQLPMAALRELATQLGFGQPQLTWPAAIWWCS